MAPSLDFFLAEIDQSYQAGSPYDLLSQLQKLSSELSASDVLELCAADIEWRWRRHAESKKSPGMLSIDPLEIATTYAGMLPDQLRDEFRLNEFQVRNRWGDQPRIKDWLSSYPCSLEHRYREGLNEVGRVCWTAREEYRLVQKGTLEGSLEIGRQSLGEPNPYQMAHDKRLIIAQSHERTISRSHVLIERESLQECRVTNGSASNLLCCESVLAPLQSVIVKLPINIQNEDHFFEFYLHRTIPASND